MNGLTENVKTEINVDNITLANFLLAVSDVHKVNINVSPELNQISIANNFTDVSVADLLVFLCKEYNLTIDFTGNILSIKQYFEPPKLPKNGSSPLPTTQIIRPFLSMRKEIRFTTSLNALWMKLEKT